MSKETIRRPDNKDNKYRENNEVQSTIVTIGLHFIHRYIGLHHFFSHSPTPKPMYDTIWCLSWVRYDLVLVLDTIRSLCCLLYDINLRATATTILRIRGVQIPIDLVSSATDSYGRSVVLFKPMSVPTSDLKSEFLYQSSSLVRDLQTSP